LWSWPDLNHPVFVGPQSVSSIGPAGKPLRRRKRVSEGAVFHAPVERYTTGASGWAASSSRYIVAMPGTGLRAPSDLMNVFHAAIIGRGSDVEITVSSRSEMMPWVTVVPTTSTGASIVSACGDPMNTWCHPGDRPWPRTVRSM